MEDILKYLFANLNGMTESILLFILIFYDTFLGSRWRKNKGVARTSDGGSGYIELVPFVNGSASKYIAVVGSQTLSAWKTFAFNDSVVHNTGDESIGSNKPISQ